MKIRRRVYRSGQVGWQLDYGLVDGRRKQEAFETREDAEKEMKAVLKARKRHGELGHDVTPGELAEFVTARDRLGSVPIIKAVEYYLTHATVVTAPLTMPELIERYLTAKPDENLSRLSRVNVVGSLNSLARWVAPKLAHEVTREEVQDWLRGNGWMPKTRNNYLGDVRSLFKWACDKRRKHAAENPTDGIERARLGDREIETLSVPQCSALLGAAWRQRGKPLVGFLTLGLFCGLRPREINRLQWSAVDLDGRTVVVAGPKAKTRKRRVVDLPENAVAWLRRCRRLAAGNVCPRDFAGRWRRLRERCKWTTSGKDGKKPWPHDAMRHTYASMHYAAHQNEQLLQAQMGHESDDMLHRHYRAIVTKVEAEKFWQLRPPTKG